MFAVPVAGVVIKASLLALLTIACVSDLRARRIPNRLVLVVAIIGIASEVVTKSWVAGLTQAGEGLALGFVIWLPFYALRMVGAGDVKLFAAASTFLGPHAAVEAALYTALFGGVMALAFMVIRSGWAATFIRVGHAMHQPLLLRNTPSPERRRMPYALAIAAGVLTVIWWPGYMMR
jgi:prepilin peptidase CpaA